MYVKRGVKKKHVLEHKQKATLGMRRSACSLVAFTSSCHEVGGLRPQVIPINQRLLTDAQARLVRNELGSRPTCNLLGRRSSWVNGPVLAEIISMVGRCSVSVMPVAHVILVMGCCPVHCTVSVLRAAASVSMDVLFVPSSMTGVQQPLVAYTSSQVKRRLRDRVEMLQQRSRGVYVANKDVVLATFDVAVGTLAET